MLAFMLSSILDNIILYPLEDGLKYLQFLYCLIAHTRDIQCGLGQRQLTYMMLDIWYSHYPNLAVHALDIIVSGSVQNSSIVLSYGSWRDITGLCHYLYKNSGKGCEHPFIEIAMEMMNKQLYRDYSPEKTSATSCFNHRFPTNASKWTPRENSQFGWMFKPMALSWAKTHHPYILRSAKTSDQYAKSVLKCKTIYRKMISTLTRRLDLVECRQCANQWDQISPSTVNKSTLAKNWNGFFNISTDLSHTVEPDNMRRGQCADLFHTHYENIHLGDLTFGSGDDNNIEWLSGSGSSYGSGSGSSYGLNSLAKYVKYAMLYNDHINNNNMNNNQSPSNLSTEFCQSCVVPPDQERSKVLYSYSNAINKQWMQISQLFLTHSVSLQNNTTFGSLHNTIPIIHVANISSIYDIHLLNAIGQACLIAEHCSAGRRILFAGTKPIWINLETTINDGFVSSIQTILNEIKGFIPIGSSGVQHSNHLHSVRLFVKKTLDQCTLFLPKTDNDHIDIVVLDGIRTPSASAYGSLQNMYGKSELIRLTPTDVSLSSDMPPPPDQDLSNYNNIVKSFTNLYSERYAIMEQCFTTNIFQYVS